MKKKIYILLSLFFLVMMINSIIGLVLWIKDNKTNKKIVEKEEVHIIEETDRVYLD